jgi:hypothetical protein
MVSLNLTDLFETELVAETQRARAHAREAARARGVSWSACGPGAFSRRPAAELFGVAQPKFESRKAWRESASGRFANAIAAGRQAAAAAHQACERAQAAWSRDFEAEAAACAAAIQDLETEALSLLRTAREAAQSLSSLGPSPTDPARGARNEPRTDAHG